MTSDEMPLKPCPFCNQQVVLKFQEGQEYKNFEGYSAVSQDCYVIECRNKHVIKVYDNKKNKAVAKWNTRADIVPDDKDVAEAVDYLQNKNGVMEADDYLRYDDCLKTVIQAANAKRNCEGLVRALEQVSGYCIPVDREDGYKAWRSLAEEMASAAEKALAEYRKE